jgi:DNA-binding beta-propeller fold protein YncE
MGIRRSRVISLALAFLLVGCAGQVAAPRDAAPTLAPERTTGNAASDLLYVAGGGSVMEQRVRVIDARTGSLVREVPGGVVSRDRSTLYSTEYVEGGTQTRITLTDLATDARRSSFTIPGAFRTMWEGGFVPVGPPAEGRWLVLTHDPHKIDGLHVTQYAVVDTIARTSTSLELRDAWPFEFAALSPDGKRIYLVDHSPSGQRLGFRVYDMGAKAFRPTGVPGTESSEGQASPLRSSAVASPDGRWFFTLQTTVSETPFVIALDTMADRASRVAFPADQKATSDFSMVWSLVMTRDGATLYAVNPAFGFINEIDVATMSLRRTAKLRATRADRGDLFAAIHRALFPVADAKMLLRSGAVLSPDERTLYAAGETGLAVIDTRTFATRTWHSGWAFNLIAMSPDGERLHAVTNDAWSTITAMSAHDGAMLGGVRMPWYPMAILRVDLAR